MGLIALVVASSGIASILLDGGRTSHQFRATELSTVRHCASDFHKDWCEFNRQSCRSWQELAGAEYRQENVRKLRQEEYLTLGSDSV